MFYTYIHYKKDNTDPFYIGKGKGNRFCSRSNRNKWWKNIVEKHDFNAQILAYWETEKEAFEHEKFLISCFKDLGHKLVNMTDGGEGSSGWIPTPEWRLKRSEHQRKLFSDKNNNPMSNEVSRNKKSLTSKGKKLSDEHKKKISDSLMGNKYSLGKNLSEDHKKKISNSLIGNSRTKGKFLSDEHKLKLSLAQKGKKKSPEVVAKQIASRKLTYERKLGLLISKELSK